MVGNENKGGKTIMQREFVVKRRLSRTTRETDHDLLYNNNNSQYRNGSL